MTRFSSFRSAVCAAPCLMGIGVGALANAQGYAFTALSNIDGTPTIAFAINSSGSVVGSSAGRAALWSGATATDLGSGIGLGINNSGLVVGQSASRATLWNGITAIDLGEGWASAINSSNQIVGRSNGSATLWNGVTAIDLGTLGGTGRNARSINEAGTIVGDSFTAGGAGLHATLWTSGTRIDLGTLGGGNSSAFAINDLGKVVGYSQTFDGVAHATIWNGTTAIDLGPYSAAQDINNAGQVVGESLFAGFSHNHATVWVGTTPVDLNTLLDSNAIGWTLTQALALNDAGQIVGVGYEHYSELFNADNQRAFLLTPCASCVIVPTLPVSPVASVPEPETYAMLLAALGLLGWHARRSKKARVS